MMFTLEQSSNPLRCFTLYTWPETALFVNYFFMCKRSLGPAVSEESDTQSSWIASHIPTFDKAEPSIREDVHPNTSHARLSELTSSPQLKSSQRSRALMPAPWSLKIYRLAKKGYQLSDCEDAWAFACNGVHHFCTDYPNYYSQNFSWPEQENWLSIAISDGASDSFASAQWAGLLVKHACAVRGTICQYSDAQLLRWIEELADAWRNSFDWQNLPWYAEEKAHAGAHATLLVCELKSTLHGGRQSWSYKALAVGDSCLFHFRRGQLLQMVPKLSSEEFGCTPYLVATDPAYNRRYLQHEAIARTHGELFPGDELWLATDALSAWIAQQCRQHRDQAPFAGDSVNVTFFDQLRTDQRMRNDDVTFVYLRWLSP